MIFVSFEVELAVLSWVWFDWVKLVEGEVEIKSNITLLFLIAC